MTMTSFGRERPFCGGCWWLKNLGFHGDSGIWMKFGVPVEFAYQNILGEVREKVC